MSERGLQISDSSVKKLVARLGVAAGLPFPVHVHQLRHACGYYLVNEGMPLPLLQRWLGHVNVQHTIHYAELSPLAFKEWRAEWKRARKQKEVMLLAPRVGAVICAGSEATRWRQLPPASFDACPDGRAARAAGYGCRRTQPRPSVKNRSYASIP